MIISVPFQKQVLEQSTSAITQNSDIPLLSNDKNQQQQKELPPTNQEEKGETQYSYQPSFSKNSFKNSITLPCQFFENLQDLDRLNQQCNDLLSEAKRPSNSMFNFSLHGSAKYNPLKAPSGVKKYSRAKE